MVGVGLSNGTSVDELEHVGEDTNLELLGRVGTIGSHSEIRRESE